MVSGVNALLFGDILRLSAQRHPQRLAVICDDRQISYGALDADANRFANGVAALGIGKGRAVAVMSRNRADYASVIFGNARAGTLLVNLSPQFGPRECIHILNETGAALLVVEADMQAHIADLLDQVPALRHIVVFGAPTLPGAIAYGDFLAAQPVRPPEIALAESDPFAMTFTGGTTGFPKGALVGHRARIASAYITALEHEIIGNDVVAVVTPLYHAIGGTVWFPAAVLTGATCVLIGKWDAGAFIATVERHAVSAAMMVPVQVREMLDHAGAAVQPLASLVKLGIGGATVSAELKAESRARLPHARVVDHYGQSETGPLALFKPWHGADKFHTIGRPAIGVDFRVVDAQGSPVPAGEVGEIVIRGDFMMDGYFNNPEETAAYFRSGDGWGWTGDLARVDADGFVELVGRSKDMIVSGGLNIYPREVEIVLEAHEAVAECTVFGIPHEKWGEALVAYVVRAPGHDVEAAVLIECCARELARYKRPAVLRFVDDIPKTPSGKIQKPALRARFLAEQAGG
jgi:acyl-CoA synthetase (AMP-forming)/AMP-acid ligase II